MISITSEGVSKSNTFFFSTGIITDLDYLSYIKIVVREDVFPYKKLDSSNWIYKYRLWIDVVIY